MSELYRSGENLSFRDEPKMYLPAKNGRNSRNEIVKPAEAATERRKVATWTAREVMGETRNENGFGRKIWHENENILTLISINETNNFPHYGSFGAPGRFQFESNKGHRRINLWLLVYEAMSLLYSLTICTTVLCQFSWAFVWSTSISAQSPVMRIYQRY